MRLAPFLALALGTAVLALPLPTATAAAAAVTPAPSGKPAAATAAARTPAMKSKTSDAPADEYFGPFKYSALSIRSKIGALGRSYRERWSDDASLVHDAGLLESSLRAWAAKYPKDVWIAPTAFHLAQLYNEIQTQEARDHAKIWFAYVAKTFPGTKEAHAARLRTAQGYPAFHAESAVNPTPSPYGPPSAAPAASGAPAPSASGSGAPSATTPGAVPSASALPKTPAPAPSPTH